MGSVSTLHRRTFLRCLAELGASATGLALLNGCGLQPFASQPVRVARVGYVGEPDEPRFKSLIDGLQELGWVDGRTMTVERRALPGTDAELSAVITELIDLPVDVLLTVSTRGTLAAKQASSTVPIVFISVTNPVEAGVVASLASPGSNVTGVSGGASTPTSGKQVELLHEVVPGLLNLALISESTTSSGGAVVLAQMQEAARVFGMQVQALNVPPDGSADDLANAFAKAKLRPNSGVVIRGAPGGSGQLARLADLAAQSHLPVMYASRESVEAGGLMSYGLSQAALHRRAAAYVDKILRGARPANLPVEQLTTVEFVVNLKTAQSQGITFPPDVAAQVTEWLQ